MDKPTIFPPTSASLPKLAKIQGDDRCVLTVYFPGSLAGGKKMPTQLTELPTSLLRAESLTRDEDEHRRRSLELWRAEVPKVSLPPAMGWVGVVSWLTEDVTFMQLPAAVEPAADAVLLGCISLGALVLTALLLIGDLRLGLLSMIPNLIPVYLTLALMGWLGIAMSISTLLIGSLVIGVAVDDTIHFMHKFMGYREETGDPREAVRRTIATTGTALLTTSLVLATSFFIFVTAHFYALVYFGILAGFATIVAFLADVLTAPALMVLASPRSPGANRRIPSSGAARVPPP